VTRLQKIRQAFADYVASEGCSCCRNEERHADAAARLAELMDVPPYKDGSGHDFYRFRTPKPSKRSKTT
jgi:hypothetical protein